MSKIQGKFGIEEILIGLQGVASTDTKYAPKAQGLLGWYSVKGEFTLKQKAFAVDMIQQCRKLLSKKQERAKTYYLYAIDDGCYIKIGYSSSPGSRLKTIQTGHPSKMNLVWQLSVGQNKSIAEKAEKKLHRYCRKFSKRGEWFERGCMVLVQQFGIKHEIEKQRKEQELEIAIVGEAMCRL